MAQKHFSMSAKQLCASGDKACKAELKRRGRDSSGKKIGSNAKKSEWPAFEMTAVEKKTYHSRRAAGWDEDRAIKIVIAERAEVKEAASYKKAWAGFPRLAGGMEGSSLQDPKYGYSVYKGDLVYDDMDQAGATSWGVTVERKGSKYNAIEWFQYPEAGGYEEKKILTGASRAEAIRYLKGLKDYYGPPDPSN